MELLSLFLKPYIVIAYLGCHSLVGILDTFNLVPTSSFGNLYDANFLYFYMAIYFFIILLISLFQIFVSISVSKKFTIFIIFFWLFPGLLQVTDLINFKLTEPIILYVGGGLAPKVYNGLRI